MRYLGSKRRIAKSILPVILSTRGQDSWYVEPFVGGLNSMIHVTGKRLGADTNKYVIEMFKAIQNGWEPPGQLSSDEYTAIRNCKDNFPPELVGFVGSACSFGGKWFGGLARATGRNIVDEARRGLLKDAHLIIGVSLVVSSYDTLDIPTRSTIYCDPPYAGTTGYGETFDSNHFWGWCREQAYAGNQVFISEYEAPEDFNSVWKQTLKVPVGSNRSKQAYECLFTPNI